MAYLLKLTKDGDVSTRHVATAAEALVLIRIYAANGYTGIEAIDASDDRVISVAELMTLVRPTLD